MRIESHRMGSITILSPRGAIAQDDVEAFARAVEDQRNRTNGRLVLDFSQVSFLDSRGIESLWDFADRQREAGHTVRIAAVPELCREILELTDIAGQLDLFDSTESAVRSFL